MKVVSDNYQYAKVVQLIKDRKTFDEDKSEALEAIVMDSAKLKMIYDAARSSMGLLIYFNFKYVLLNHYMGFYMGYNILIFVTFNAH